MTTILVLIAIVGLVLVLAGSSVRIVTQYERLYERVMDEARRIQRLESDRHSEQKSGRNEQKQD